MAFELGKFGFTILRRRESQVSIERIRGQLHSALRILEDALQPIAQSQVEFGRVTIANRYAEFDGRYNFFRDKADHCFS